MKLYLNKIKCDIYEDINGHVLIVETDWPVLVEEIGSQQLLCGSDYDEREEEPFLVNKPKNFQV